MHLPDINVCLALAFDSHVHDLAAKTWFDGLPNASICFFCRLSQQGFLRLATNPSVFGKHAVTLSDAWRLNDTFMSDARVSFAAEPPELEIQWRLLTQGSTFSPKVWNDAYLAAFALSQNLELVTFDYGFSKYANLTCTILS